MFDPEKDWWETREFPGFGVHSSDVLDIRGFTSAALARVLGGGGEPIRTATVPGVFRDTTRVSEFVEVCRKIGLFAVTFLDDGSHVQLVHKHAFVDAHLVATHHYTTLAANDEVVYNQVLALLKEWFVVSPAVRGRVYALAKDSDGDYYFKQVGVTDRPLERGNYAPSVLEGYDHILADLASPSPCGRLAVFAGVPGSGKSYLVRGVVSSDVEALFVLIPPHLVESLGDPEMLPAVVNAAEGLRGDKPRPLVLIIEDGDECLVSRENDKSKRNMSIVSSVLNLGDGLLGEMLNVRLVVTTNAKEFELDPAVVRKGRLCRRVDAGTLDYEQCIGILRRLGASEEDARHVWCDAKHPMVLADVYAAAGALK